MDTFVEIIGVILVLVVLNYVVQVLLGIIRWRRQQRDANDTKGNNMGNALGIPVDGNAHLGKLSLALGAPDRLVPIGKDSGIAIYMERKLIMIGSRAFPFSDILRFEPIDDACVNYGAIEAQTLFNSWGRRPSSSSTYYKMRGGNKTTHDCTLIIMVKDLLHPQVQVKFGPNRGAMYEVVALLENIKSVNIKSDGYNE